MRKIRILILIFLMSISQISFARDTLTQDPPMVPILEYHNFGDTESRWTRTYDNFYNDLLWLYNNDFRPVKLDDFINMNFQLEAGMRPVVITFDDSSRSQFWLLEDGSIDPLSAVGVMEKFAEDYPDFGKAGTFFVLPQGFAQPDKITEKFKFLIDSGFEVENHTYGHESLSTASNDVIKRTLAQNNQFVKEHLGEDYNTKYLSYPYGNYLDPETIEIVKDGEYEENKYSISAGFLVGAEPSLMPNNPDFDPYLIPRIQAIDDEWKRWFKREPGETERSEREFAFVPYSTGVDYSAEIEPPEPSYPYENCKPYDYEFTRFSDVFWKWAAFQKTKIQANRIPEELKYKDGNFVYVLREGENAQIVAEKFFGNSRHYRISDFAARIVEVNLDTVFEKDTEIIIPDIPFLLLKFPTREDNLWGIYLTAYYSVADEGRRLIEELKGRGGRLLVFDVKEINGHVYYPTAAKLAHETGAQRVVIPSLYNFVRYWHGQDIYLAARLVVFKDINLANARNDLAVQNRTGGVWTGEGIAWLDPSNEETQEYILDLVEELARSGVDEIQFDYIRFPTQGNVGNAKYGFDEVGTEKYEVIRNFIVRVYDRLRPYDTKLALDVYGVIVWNNGYDSISTGQKMECLGPYIDTVYPMVYPSHFGPGFGGFAQPGAHPYYFVNESLKLFQYYLEGTDTEIRPWLQAFAWRVPNYGWWYVEEQVKAAADRGIFGYALWNASNVYF